MIQTYIYSTINKHIQQDSSCAYSQILENTTPYILFQHFPSAWQLRYSSFITLLILDNKMSTELSFLDRLVEELLKSKHNNYSEDCINFYIDDEFFSIENITKIHNRSNERLKCSLIKHKPSLESSTPALNSKCIIYLHGFGSSRLQALSLVEQLPKEYCLCIFDMSGSGKSEGEKITYGLKEQEDIDPVINYLHARRGLGEFVIWGRSMGAVAGLLYATSHPKLNFQFRSREKLPLSATQSLKNSAIFTSKVVEEGPVILGLVLDSPFCNFKEIAKQIAQKKLTIPSFLLDVALSYVEESFAKILSQSIGQHYNPFRIDFGTRICLSIPAIFLYSENDEIIAPSHCQRLIRNMGSKYKRILINSCTHNQSRPPEALSEVFTALASFAKKHHREEANSIELNRSVEKKRGICVYTPSKEFKREESPSANPLKFYQAVTVQLVRTDEPLPKSPRNRTNSKRHMINLQSSKQKKHIKQLETVATENNLVGKLHTLDLEMNKFLNKKLIDPQQQNKGLKMTRVSKRFGYDKRREIRLSNEKYLK